MPRGSLARRLEAGTGAVLIEFALSLPILLLVIVGIFDFGFAFQQYVVATNAAREGARMAVLPAAYSDQDIQDRVTAYLTAGGVKATPRIAIQPVVITPDGGALPFMTRKITVQIDHTFAYLAPFAKWTDAGTVTLTAVAQMRTEIPAGNP